MYIISFQLLLFTLCVIIMSEAKLQKLLSINERLRAEESLPRIKVSEASQELVSYVKNTQDPLVEPSETVENPFTKRSRKIQCTIL